MGPNGAGKSTLSSVIAGKRLQKFEGEILFEGENIIEDALKKEAQRNFPFFQYPVEIPGVTVTNFIKAAITKQKSKWFRRYAHQKKC